MAKKRANGEGNIRKRADGRWEGRYTAGYHPETGKRIIYLSISFEYSSVCLSMCGRGPTILMSPISTFQN